MAATITWTEGAAEDLAGVVAYIAADSPHYAVHTADRIIETIDRLVEFPHMGHVVPEYEDDAVRESIWHTYRIVYHVQADRVTILAIVHGARLLADFRDRLDPSQPDGA